MYLLKITSTLQNTVQTIHFLFVSGLSVGSHQSVWDRGPLCTRPFLGCVKEEMFGEGGGGAECISGGIM